jgi:ribulose-phosphate 3-epimerase
MRISASVAAVEDSRLPLVVSALDEAGVDAYHLDSIDDASIFDFSRKLRTLTQKPFDLHLITDKPENYWSMLEESQLPQIVLQLENLKKPLFIPESLKGKVGLAMMASTDPRRFSVYRRDAAFLLLMLTTPGKSGGKFNPTHFANIIRYRQRYPEIPLIIDGGVNEEVAAVLHMMGIYQVVSGSFLFSRPSIREAVEAIHHNLKTAWAVKDVMDTHLDGFTQLQQVFGVQPECWYIGRSGKAEQINLNSTFAPLLEQISQFEETAGSAIFTDELTPLTVLFESASNLTNAPRYVFALNDNQRISGSLFIQTNA